MPDLHDGLGTNLFLALTRLAQGHAATDGLAQLLRDCIADMRLTFEVAAPESGALHGVLSNFRFRWENLLREAGLSTRWQLDLPADDAMLPPDLLLQALRVAQEALTNVLKHSRASTVNVHWQLDARRLSLRVHDDGAGLARNAADPAVAPPADGGGRGLSGMRRRAARLGGRLDIESDAGGTCVSLDLPRGVG
jgi:signal transduction histidine kinase